MHVGRQHGSARAFILAPLTAEFVRSDHGNLRPRRANGGGHRLFVGRITVGMQEAHRDRLDSLVPEMPEYGRKTREVDFPFDLTLVIAALVEFQAQMPLDERLRLRETEVE